jgi:CRISPR-associated protein Csx3
VTMPAVLPAVLIGGPPHTGKSVLSYSLHQRLREHGIEHYLYRACPDGEGDWFHEGPTDLVRMIRADVKGTWTPTFSAMVCRHLAQRPLPWLVDVGGKPGPLDEPIFRACTHAILLTNNDETHARWLTLVEWAGLHLLADLYSVETGASSIAAEAPVIRGTVANMRRGEIATGGVIDLLVEQLAPLLQFGQAELRQIRLGQAPAEHVLELDRLNPDNTPTTQADWRPAHLSWLLEQAPRNTSLALYGGGTPNWVVGAIAAATAPVELAQFTIRQGWVRVPALATSPFVGDHWREVACGLEGWVRAAGDHTALDLFLLPGVNELDDERMDTLCLPALPLERGVICSGQLPLWFWAALAWTYRQAPWLAFYQPRLNSAIVVATRDQTKRLGDLLPFTPLDRPDASQLSR